jgi:hypothetical protein
VEQEKKERTLIAGWLNRRLKRTITAPALLNLHRSLLLIAGVQGCRNRPSEELRQEVITQDDPQDVAY